MIALPERGGEPLLPSFHGRPFRTFKWEGEESGSDGDVRGGRKGQGGEIKVDCAVVGREGGGRWVEEEVAEKQVSGPSFLPFPPSLLALAQPLLLFPPWHPFTTTVVVVEEEEEEGPAREQEGRKEACRRRLG